MDVTILKGMTFFNEKMNISTSESSKVPGENHEFIRNDALRMLKHLCCLGLTMVEVLVNQSDCIL